MRNRLFSLPVKHTLGRALDEELRSSSEFRGFQRYAVRRHRFTITGELKGELFLPLGLDVLSDDNGSFTTTESGLSDVERIDLLGQNNKGGLGGFTDFLEGLLELVKVDGRVVAHNTGGAELVESLEVVAPDFLALEEDFTDGLVGWSGDLELEEAAVVAFDLVEDEHAAKTRQRQYTRIWEEY